MKDFKIQRDKIAGVCQGCDMANVKITQANQTIVWCTQNDKRVLEPLSYCSVRVPTEIAIYELPKWMRQTAWIPTKVGRGGSTKRTFADPRSMEGGVQDGFKRIKKAAAGL